MNEEKMRNEMRSKVYNALSEIMFEYRNEDFETQKKCMDAAIEWFQIQFYETREY